MNKDLWGGRFSSGPDATMRLFSTSLPVDGRLWQQDIRGSIAHVRMLAHAEILTHDEAAEIEAGLEQIADDISAGTLTMQGADDEDIHSFVERTLRERIGALAGKLHTARSRNDQIALDVRLYMREALAAVMEETRLLQQAL